MLSKETIERIEQEMANKTAMQRVASAFNEFESTDEFYIWVHNNLSKLLEEEKQQIIDAWVDGGKMISSAKNAETYYNQTYTP